MRKKKIEFIRRITLLDTFSPKNDFILIVFWIFLKVQLLFLFSSNSASDSLLYNLLSELLQAQKHLKQKTQSEV